MNFINPIDRPVRTVENKMIVQYNLWIVLPWLTEEGTLEREILERSKIFERKEKVSLSVREKECEGITRLLQASCTLAPPVALDQPRRWHESRGDDKLIEDLTLDIAQIDRRTDFIIAFEIRGGGMNSKLLNGQHVVIIHYNEICMSWGLVR
ncbi:hypothetical protein IEQ34_006888 [Dendrobium chrysotoxum]|uniref:Uncharacterized protein n=1 Tax=Dendrobium chrysotoxum TaxID=161865 RepID=A0AAV7H8A0_DENCH|nr:hypothetical protein IEQ34_006888 [Dendrobium chrysotoxum]